MDELKDPWGNPYQYLSFETVKGNDKGKFRKDRNLVPINSDYDLYSMGPDGKSSGPLTAAASRDDIIRAGNGSFVGIAEDY
jgi:general secretion pathway protein G